MLKLIYVHLPRFASTIFLLCFPTVGYSNAIGTDFHNFNPTSNGIDFVTVQSSEPISPGVLNLGLFFNYAVNPLYELVEDKPAGRGSVRNSLFSADINLGLGLTKNWDIGMNLPATLEQKINEPNSRIQFANSGLNEIRLNTKLRFIGDSEGGFALVLSMNNNTIEDNPYLGRDGGPIYNLELVGDWSYNKFAFGANLGYRIRNTGEKIEAVPVEPLGDQFLYSLAISRLITSLDTQLIFEIYGARPASEPELEETKLHMTSSEALFGIKHLFNHNLAIHAGGSTYIESNATSPDYRIYTGINWTLGPIWKQKRRKRKKVKKPPVTPEAPLPMPVYEPELEVEPILNAQPQLFVLENVEFELDSSTKIGQNSLREINKIGEYLVATGYKRIIVEGHTDSLGSVAYNLKLSKDRAINVGAHLIKKFNIDENLIEVKGFGESRPIADNSTFQGRQRNRRVEIRVFK